jgi:TPR repeat protein
MTSLCQQINRIAIVVIMAIVCVACAEKSADSNPVEKVVSTVTEDKIGQLQREAQEGNPDAQYELAYHYENGLDVPKDETSALDLYQQAADQGHPTAQNNIDSMSKSK